MSKNKKEIIEVEPIGVEDIAAKDEDKGLTLKHEDKPTLEQGNYVIEVISEGRVIKKLVVANSEINITKLANGGMTVDLK